MSYQAKHQVVIFWFRRDLRLDDNAGLYHALRSGYPVLPIYIFDTNILHWLEDHADPRITFIHQQLEALNNRLHQHSSSLLVKYGDPVECLKQLLDDLVVRGIYLNHDYEPYARERDSKVSELFRERGLEFYHFKDQVIFEKNEISKADGSPYTVFTPYKKTWLNALNDKMLYPYDCKKHFENFVLQNGKIPDLAEPGFMQSNIRFPGTDYHKIIENYHLTRDVPSIPGTSHVGVHLRFGTVSIREVVKDALSSEEKTFLNQLIWREFFAMILWHFPHIQTHSFKPEYDNIPWRNNEEEFQAWCSGRTGYPLVDAGMRELNATGFMHNRLRMVTASFLIKHLLIDWRWGEAYFAQKLLDYEMASNVGGWQWQQV